MKASLSTGTLRYANDALRYGFTRLATKKSVRRDEVARLYGVSGSVKNTFSNILKTNLCLTIKIVLLNATLNKVNDTFGRKPDKANFWLLFGC